MYKRKVLFNLQNDQIEFLKEVGFGKMSTGLAVVLSNAMRRGEGKKKKEKEKNVTSCDLDIKVDDDLCGFPESAFSDD